MRRVFADEAPGDNLYREMQDGKMVERINRLIDLGGSVHTHGRRGQA
jgi:hypothetical protein